MTSSTNYWSRFWRQRVSRRSALSAGGVGVAGAAGLALVGCGDDDDDDDSGDDDGGGGGGGETPDGGEEPTRAAGEPVPGGTFVQSQTNALRDVFDPHTSLFQAAFFWASIGNLAVRGNQQFTELNGELVESWETPGDGAEILLNVRPGVMWHDKPPTAGREMTAEDMAHNLMRIAGKLDPDNLSAYQRRSTLPNLDNAEAVDDTTVRVTLTAPHSGFINGMGDWRNTIIPKDYAEAGNFDDPLAMVGSGPWMTDSFDNEVSARFLPHPNYWDSGRPYLEELEWVWLPDANSAAGAFAQGQISSGSGASPVQRDIITSTAGDAQEYRWVQGQWTHFRFNPSQEVFADPMVRKAISLVLDYKKMSDANYGDGFWNYAGALSVAFPEALTSDEVRSRPGFNPDTKDADIAEAMALMEAAGLPDGDISFSIMPFQPTGAFFDNAIRAQDDLKGVWPDMDVTVDPPADTTTFAQRQIGGDYDLISYQLFPAPDAVLEMETNFRSEGSRNYGKFSDSTVDGLIDTAAGALDSDERTAALREAQELLVDEHHYLVISAIPDAVLYFPKDLRGFDVGRKAGGGNYDIAYGTGQMWFDPEA